MGGLFLNEINRKYFYVLGVVQANVGQKLVKSNIFTSVFLHRSKRAYFHLSDAFYKSSIIVNSTT
jgi:hypothetical protein